MTQLVAAECGDRRRADLVRQQAHQDAGAAGPGELLVDHGLVEEVARDAAVFLRIADRHDADLGAFW